jgi:AcrR family transcriptional regulator
LIDFINEGDLRPTVPKIAARAGISHRSVFRYFKDLNDLARAAIEAEYRATLPFSTIKDVGGGPLDVRIERFVAARVRTQERMHLVGLVARSRALEIPDVDEALHAIYTLGVEQTRRHFAPELDHVDEGRADAVVIAISHLTSLDSFDLLRRVEGRGTDAIASLWHFTIELLLTAPE